MDKKHWLSLSSFSRIISRRVNPSKLNEKRRNCAPYLPPSPSACLRPFFRGKTQNSSVISNTQLKCCSRRQRFPKNSFQDRYTYRRATRNCRHRTRQSIHSASVYCLPLIQFNRVYASGYGIFLTVCISLLAYG